MTQKIVKLDEVNEAISSSSLSVVEKRLILGKISLIKPINDIGDNQLYICCNCNKTVSIPLFVVSSDMTDLLDENMNCCDNPDFDEIEAETGTVEKSCVHILTFGDKKIVLD